MGSETLSRAVVSQQEIRGMLHDASYGGRPDPHGSKHALPTVLKAGGCGVGYFSPHFLEDAFSI